MASHHEEVTMVKEEPASPATRLFHTPKFDCFILAIMGSKVRVDPNVVKERAIQTLPNVPRFSSLLVKDEKRGKITWIPTTVNVENHIICPEIDNDMINSTADEFVADYIASLTAKPMDMTKPLWELHILNVKTSDGANATGMWRIHHSVGDGISLISILLALTRKTSDPESLPTIPVKKPERVENSSPITRFFSAIWAAIMLLINTLVDVALFVATLMFLKDTKTPIKGGPGVERAHKRIMHRSVSLDDIKLVKTATKATINDVILGVTQAALSQYLNRRYAGDDEQNKKATKKKSSLPKNIRLRASLIFNIRPSPGIQVLADMMRRKSKAKWGNRIGYCLLPLKIALRDDPLDYIREAQSMVNRKKHSLESRFSFAAANLILKLFGIKAATALTYRIVLNTTISLSNVVGPREEISFAGHPITYIASSVQGMPHALHILFQSYMNKMTIIVTYEPNVISDPHQLLDDIEESLQNIKDAAIRRRLENGNEP